ncbi:MAG TPA: deferrochelatase/peroxidase EfeB, partial [Pantoea agglomerans]|nr:deferrochelatase/peroxidase EfeB [Pantoea agglomerans]
MSRKEDDAQPARRRLLKGLGLLGGAAALGGGCPFHAAAADSFSPGTVTPQARQQMQPFYGQHQAGITRPQQASMMLVEFGRLSSGKG